MSNLTYGIEYLATQSLYPNTYIFSQKYPQFKVTEPELLRILSPVPTYSDGFLVYDPNNVDQRDQVTLVTPLHVSYCPSSEEASNGLLKISDGQIRNMLSRYYLHHNINTSRGFILKPKARVVIFLHIKGKDHVFFSSPVKMKYFASWNSDPEIGFDSMMHVDAYRKNFEHNRHAVDPRPIYYGHLYHKLRSEDYVVKISLDEKSGEATYHYPFDLINPDNRFKVKSLPDYIYDKKNRVLLLSEVKKQLANIPDKNLYRYAGIKGNVSDMKKYIKHVVLTPDKIVKAYKLVSKKAKEDWIPTLIKEMPDYPLYGNYEWHMSSPLQTTVSEMIYEC